MDSTGHSGAQAPHSMRSSGRLAPEQLSPACGSTGPHADIFEIGGILFFLLMGHLPVDGHDQPEVIPRALSAGRLSASICQMSCADSLSSVCARMSATRHRPHGKCGSSLSDVFASSGSVAVCQHNHNTSCDCSNSAACVVFRRPGYGL